MTIILLRLKFQLLEKKTLWVGSERNSLPRISGQLLGYLFVLHPLLVIKLQASELECIYLQNWQSSPHINPPIELCWNEMIWENSLQISFFSATLSRTQRISSTLSIFSSKRMLKRGEWVTVSEEQSVSSSGGEKNKKAIRDVPLSLQDKPLAGNNICH